MSSEPISAVEAFFKRHQDNPKLYRIIYGVAWFCLIYGFALFNVAGYHRATELSGYYAELGLFTLGVLFMFSGAMLLTIKKRKHDSGFRGPAHVIMFHLKIVWVPLFVALCFSWVPVLFLWTSDSYMELTVKATEPVKKDLKWLLGDLYPEDQEKNIDPETLEWTMVLAEKPGINHFRVIKTNSPKVTPTQRAFYSDQLNSQKFEAVWQENGEKVRRPLSIDWTKAEFFGYNENSDEYSYPICDLRAPLITELPNNQSDLKILINDQIADDHLINHRSFGFDKPSNLPDMIRIENNQLVVRTSYSGGSWPIFCLYNFPADNRLHMPEPVTSKTIGALNSSVYKLHFALLPGLHLTGSILNYQEHWFTRRSTYDEYFDRLNDFVGHSILNTTIYGRGRIEPY